MNVHVSPGNGFPALVLNADFRPLSYYPLSLWSWQDAIKAVFLERVNIVEEYDHAVHSPSMEMKLPSVVSLKTYVKPSTNPAFTRFNVFLRDRFRLGLVRQHEDAGIADDGRGRYGAAQPDMQRHHGALREADQGQGLWRQLAARQLGVEKLF